MFGGGGAGEGAPKDDEERSLRIMPQENVKPIAYHIVATRFSFEQLNQTFARQLGRPIVDQTGLQGDFNFSIDLATDENTPNPLDPSLILAAMRDQLGLVVKAQKAPVDFLVIDSVDKVAAGN